MDIFLVLIYLCCGFTCLILFQIYLLLKRIYDKLEEIRMEI